MVEDELWDNRARWGTWEELILGGAVLRHGSHDWDAVALEVQARTLYPCLFTPQACKAKYEDLQDRYSGSSSWFEELRKRRVEELRRALEKSEGSIGSLESKLETLKSEKGTCNNVAYSSSRAESPVFLKSEGNKFSGKEASKDGLSAGSFTQETQVTWSPQCEAATKTCAEEAEKTHEEKAPRLEKFPSIDKLAETIRSEGGVSIRRRRGKRKRKDLSTNGKEGSVGENNLLGSADIVTALPTKEVLAGHNGQTARSPETDDQKPCTSKQGTDDFMKILESIMENEHASVFRRRLDSQKRARYKKMIRQHMDLEMIRARITRRSITSPAELHRDLLLLANNALVFYSKCTREYKCALMLRDLATKKLHQHSKAIDSTKPSGPEAPKSPMPKPPAKPRSARPFNQKFGDKAVNTENGATVEAKRPPSNLDSPSSAESSALMKKNPARKGKVGRVRRASAGIQAETPMKVRRKARVK